LRQRGGEQPIRGELDARPHHRHGDQPRRTFRPRPPRRIALRVEKRRQGEPALRLPQQWHDAGTVGRIEADHRIGAAQRLLDRAMTGRPRTGRALRRVRGFGDDIGDAERRADRRAKPVRRLIIEVVGEPQLRRGSRRLLPAPQ
jgi:hypothetical protein